MSLEVIRTRRNFSFENIIASEFVLIPLYQQMIVHGLIVITGTLVIEGTLVLI